MDFVKLVSDNKYFKGNKRCWKPQLDLYNIYTYFLSNFLKAISDKFLPKKKAYVLKYIKYMSFNQANRYFFREKGDIIYLFQDDEKRA